MAPLQLPLSRQQARVESNRCLYCFDAPCIAACPSGIDVPGFIRRIAGGDEPAAARTILEANVLGASCARVCPTQVLCEGACVLKDRDEKPIAIGLLQRHATDWVASRSIKVLRAATKGTGRRVAVVGSGPAGLSCAATLAQLGHGVRVFERESVPGGLNSHGIALYKMTQAQALEEVNMIRQLGVEFHCGVDVGSAIPGSALLADHDSVFLGLGLGAGNRLRVPGSELAGVLDALTFIKRLHNEPHGSVPVASRVVVVGGGNTAIDAATQARRAGARSVTIIYRRSPGEMSAYSFEQEIARLDGVEFVFDRVVARILGDNGAVRGIDLADANGRGTGNIACDMVLEAIGQEKMRQALARIFPALRIDSLGRVECDERTMATSIERVFAGGDCRNGGKEVVNAVGDGKVAALSMHALMTGESHPLPMQSSRLGTQPPRGLGITNPIRVPEAPARWQGCTAGGGPSHG